jgi:hypothetical protein
VLPSSSYLITAQKTGYIRARYGQLQWNGPGTPVFVEEQGNFVAVLRLKKSGVVRGTVLDENQIGLPGLQVMVYRAGRPLKPIAAGVTDDRGVYRISGLEPASYAVASAARQLEDGRSLLPTFFGATANPQDAKSVEVRLDEEAGGIDIDPLPGRLYRLSGKVISSAPVSLAVYSDLGKRQVSVDSGGRFQLDQLPPGNYQLLAEAVGSPLAGYQKLLLNGDMENVVVEMAPAPTLRIRWEEDGKPVDGRDISAFIRRTDPPEDAAQRRVLGTEVPALVPGTWEIAVAPPTGSYVRSIFAKSGDVSHEFTLAPAQALELTVALSSHPATLRGKVTTAAGQPALAPPVYLSPVEPDLRSRLNGGRTARASLDGEYVFAGLPPGRYRVFSSFQAAGPDDGAALGKPVTMEEGKETTLDLELQ